VTFPTAALPYSASVAFYNSTLQLPLANPNVLTITQEEFAHDVAVMEFWGGDVDDAALASGMPMILTFGTPGLMRVFYGYVNHVTRTNVAASTAQTLTSRNAITVTCVGASWPMKAPGTVAWYNLTASQIVQSIADQFHLGAQIAPHATVWPVRQMAGQTYWQFCAWLAQLVGYTFYVSGATLVFKPRQTNPSALTSVVAVYDYKHNPAGLISFSPTLGANAPTGGHLAQRQLAGINPRTNQVVYTQLAGPAAPTQLGSVANTPVFRSVGHATFHTQQEADTLIEGAGNLNQLYITATGMTSGNAAISQGSLVFVQNANGSQNGLWLVTKAVHRLDTTTYATDLTFGRDSLGGANSLGYVPQTKVPAPAYLRNGWWVAA